MKPQLTLIPILLALLAMPGFMVVGEDVDVRKEAAAIRTFNQPSPRSIGIYAFPLTVDSFVTNLGKPDSTFIDKSEFCSIGQIHRWCLPDENLKVVVVGDSYGREVMYSAESRLFAVTVCDPGKDSGFAGLWGIRLGDQDENLLQMLSKIAGQEDRDALTRNIKGVPVHFLLDGRSVSHYHALRKGDAFFYFVIDNQSRLLTIIQSCYDVSIVC